MKIIRIGLSSKSYTRYLDLALRPDIEKCIFITEDDRELDDALDYAIKILDLPGALKKKFVIYSLKRPLFIRVILGCINILQRFRPSRIERAANRVIEHSAALLLRRMSWATLENAIKAFDPDFMWTGNNDFDGSNILTWWAISRKLGLPVIRSYKEHRCRYRVDEKHALLDSDRLILPSMRNVKAFEEIYGAKLAEKTLVADEDWRFSGLIDYVNRIRAGKLSARDGIPHVVILSGMVTYGDGDFRRYSRYNYLSIIDELVKNGLHVHLHTKSIIESTNNPVTHPDNPYRRMSLATHLFHIEKPLNLDTDWRDYRVLKKYDAGILHNYMRDEPIAPFTEMNVPNRLYEYQVSGVLPVVVKATLLDVEDIIVRSGFGIIGSSYSDIAHQLKGMMKNDSPRSLTLPSFNNYVDVLLEAYARLEACPRPR